MRRVAVAVATAWLAAASGPATAVERGPIRTVEIRPADDGKPQPCHAVGISSGVLCGRLTRPLDPARPAAASIVVEFVVVPAASRNRLPDPVFFIAGGPGQSAIAVAGQVLPLLARLNNRRDLVFVDQRGTGRSAPLDCGDDEDDSLAGLSDPERQRASVVRCKARLLRLRHVPDARSLGLYTTAIASRDLDAVRDAIGAERVNLVGVSYGTRVALDYARQFPQRVRRSVLDGVAPPDMALPESFGTDNEAAWRALLAACAAEASCAAAHPRLGDRFAAFLDALPQEVQATHPVNGRTERFVLTRDAVLAAVRSALYVPALASALPEAVDAATRGDLRGLLGLQAALLPSRSARPALGMHLSVVCSEDLLRAVAAGTAASSIGGASLGAAAGALDAPARRDLAGNTAAANPRRADVGSSGAGPADAATAASGVRASVAPSGRDVFGAASVASYARLCAEWPRGDVPDAFFRIAPSASPVLVLSGGIDPATPPRHAERVVAALGAQARHVVVGQAGHGVLGVGCVRDVVARFVDAASDRDALAVDASCAKDVPRPPAFVSIGAAPSR